MNQTKLHPDCEKLLYSKTQIQDKVFELGARITEDYRGERIVFVSILNGAFIFSADLVRAVDLPCECSFMRVSTYGNAATSSGELKIKADLQTDIAGKHVIIIEDILDTGYTLYHLKRYLAEKKPKSLKICAFIDKPARRKVEVKADYSGFLLHEDLFLVGYGLDYAERYRNLPYVGILNPKIYS